MSFAHTFKALSDPVRRQILEILKSGSLSAGDIASQFEMTGATISYHLKVLKQADLIFESRKKNYIYYQLNTSALEEIMLWISDLKGGSLDVEKTCNNITHHKHCYDSANIDRHHMLESPPR